MGACCVILGHVNWALSFRAAKTVTWTLTREWALARDTIVLDDVHLIESEILASSIVSMLTFTFKHSIDRAHDSRL